MTYTLDEKEMQQYRHKGKILEALEKAEKNLPESTRVQPLYRELVRKALNEVRKELGL